MTPIYPKLKAWLTVLMVLAHTPALYAASLAITDAEKLALKVDRVTKSFSSLSKAFGEQAIAEDSWTDPKVSFGSMNLPGNDLNPSDQGMLELKIEQMLPRGDSNTIKRKKNELMGQGADIKLAGRRKEILREVRLAWLDTWYWQQVTQQLQQDRYLFKSLKTVTESMYRQGRKDQQDLLSAELALSRLDDRIVSSQTSLKTSQSLLNRWLGKSETHSLSQQLPQLKNLVEPTLGQLKNHPKVQLEELNISQSEQDVALAQEAYTPQWGVEFKYNRDMSDINSGMTMGSERNKYSLMLMVDLPLFTGNRQDRKLSASQYRKEAAFMQRQDVLQQIVGQAQTEYARYQGLQKRVELYSNQLLPQVNRQAEATLKAYQADASDFSSVIQSYISRLNLTIEYQRLRVDTLQSEARLQYLMPELQEHRL